ncbi:MAG: hypothetical protein R6X25_09830 [Candidatus Krumholzibacteriia bacterium]
MLRIDWAWPDWAWPLLLLAAGAAVLFAVRVYRLTVPAPAPGLRRFLTALRGAALVLLLVAVARPVLSRLGSEFVPPEVAVIVDDSASMQIADAVDAATDRDGPRASRWDAAGAVAGRVAAVLAARDDPVRVEVLRGNGIDALRPLPADGGEPVAVGTDLTRLLFQAAQRFAGRPLGAVLLLSDGHETVSDAAVSAAAPAGAELHLVGLGDPVGPPDRVLRDLRYPDVAFEGDEVVIELAVGQRFAAGADSLPLTVQLLEDGEPVTETSRATAGEVTRLELAFRPREAGLHVYRLVVSPIDNERYLANNEATIAVNVRKERAQLLLLADRPGWDARFLAQAAARERRLELDVVYPGPAGPLLADSLTVWTPPADADGWHRWEGVILLGWEGRTGPIDWPVLAEAVREGLGLWVLPPAFDLSRAPAPARLPAALAELLPVAGRDLPARPGEWLVRVPGDAPGHPVLAGVTDDGGAGGPGARPAGLTGLPPLEVLLPAAPGADDRVLLVARQRDAGDLELPLLIVGTRGEGRVIWFGGRRLWELAFWERPGEAGPAGEQPMRRLLRNLLVWTASGREEGGLALVGRRHVFQEGERIRIEAQWRDIRGEPVLGRPVAVEVREHDESATGDPAEAPPRRYSLAPVPGLAGISAALLPPLPPGRYDVRPVAVGGDETADWQPLVVTGSSVERAQVRQDRRRLRQLAAAAGGRYHDTSTAGAVADLLDAVAALELESEERRLRRRWDLWAGWPLLVAAAVLLATEWILRRRYGLL